LGFVRGVEMLEGWREKNGNKEVRKEKKKYKEMEKEK
jgi:hypothetical protein